jgi:hypothetical protein
MTTAKYYEGNGKSIMKNDLKHKPDLEDLGTKNPSLAWQANALAGHAKFDGFHWNTSELPPLTKSRVYESYRPPPVRSGEVCVQQCGLFSKRSEGGKRHGLAEMTVPRPISFRSTGQSSILNHVVPASSGDPVTPEVVRAYTDPMKHQTEVVKHALCQLLATVGSTALSQSSSSGAPLSVDAHGGVGGGQQTGESSGKRPMDASAAIGILSAEPLVIETNYNHDTLNPRPAALCPEHSPPHP